MPEKLTQCSMHWIEKIHNSSSKHAFQALKHYSYKTHTPLDEVNLFLFLYINNFQESLKTNNKLPTANEQHKISIPKMVHTDILSNPSSSQNTYIDDASQINTINPPKNAITNQNMNDFLKLVNSFKSYLPGSHNMKIEILSPHKDIKSALRNINCHKLPTIDIVAWDVETTGLRTKTDHVISIAFIFYQANTPDKLFAFHSYINPGIQGLCMPKQAQNVHGISMEMLQNEPTLHDLKKLIHWTLNDRIIIGHNSHRFDLEILKNNLLQRGLDEFIPNPSIHFDTIELMKFVYPNTSRTLQNTWEFARNLNELHLDWNTSAAHNAEYDALKALETFALLNLHHCWSIPIHRGDLDGEIDFVCIQPWVFSTKTKLEHLLEHPVSL